MYLPILHLLRVELHCKLQEKYHRVTGLLKGYVFFWFIDKNFKEVTCLILYYCTLLYIQTLFVIVISQQPTHNSQ